MVGSEVYSVNEEVMKEREKIIKYNKAFIKKNKTCPPTSLEYYKFVKVRLLIS